jgi:hypothetical protein
LRGEGTPPRMPPAAPPLPLPGGSAPMLIEKKIPPDALMEVLGSVEPSSPNPRRNTSKSFFEESVSGDKADSCFLFVATLSLPLSIFAGKWIQRGNKAETRFHFETI